MPISRTWAVVWCTFFFFFSSRRRHTRLQGDWSSDVCSSEHGRKVAAAESVHQVVVYGEARVLDDARGVDDLLHAGTVADDAGHGVERRFRGVVEFPEKRGRFGRHGKGPQDLPRIVEELGGDLGGDHVARPYLAGRGELARHAVLRVRHRRYEEKMDVGHAAERVVSRFADGAQLVLGHPGPRFAPQSLDRKSTRLNS